MTFIDSHCHLDRIDHKEHSLDTLLNIAKEAGVTEMLCVSIGLNNWQAMADLVAPYENIHLSVGIHPCNVLSEPLPTAENFAPLMADPRVIATGETGLDYHYGSDSKREQQEYFIRQIALAKQFNKPLIIHTRDAREDTINILRAEEARDIRGILHCFTESWEMAKKGLDLGFFLSFSGIITFKNAADLREVVRKAPLDRLLIETDAPYLAPVPHRGKVNHPALVTHVAKSIAEVKGLSLAEVAQITTDNFNRLFQEQKRSRAQ